MRWREEEEEKREGGTESYLTAFMMGNKYTVNSLLMPCLCACSKIKVNGKNMPQKKKNNPALVTAMIGSLSESKYSLNTNFVGRGGSRLLIVRHAIDISPRKRNETARTAHPNPTRSISFDSMMGRTTPPKEDPAATMPTAMARCRKNQDMVDASAALKTAAEPRDETIPCARMNW